MDQLRFDDRVAIVTGAGGGLGRAYALLLGSRGAKVVVNDLGGSRDGDGKSSSLADAVVNEIKANGGSAVADYNSVVEGDKIVKTAIDNFGRIDIIINNAGILRDRSFPKISEQDWDLIQAVHVKGAFKVTQAAWEIFKKQKYGRVIMTASNAGIFGNFGQANYSTAKLGLVGLANTLCIEGAKYNIKVNTIVPTAASRLTEDILPPDMFQAMKPELIAPVVGYMVHESFPETGAIIDSTLGFATKAHFVRGQGTVLRNKPTDAVTIESVKDHWNQVVDMSNAKHLDKITDVTLELVEKLQDFEDRAKMDNGKESYWSNYEYNSKDLVTYALGVGASTANESDLRYLYESHEEFSALPSFFILAGMNMESPLVGNAMPAGKYADFTNILHGEQYIEFVGDEFPGTEGRFESRSYIADLLDKGSSAIAIVNSEVYQNRQLMFKTQQHIFVVNQGGFGGPRTSANAIDVQAAPKRAPDAVVEQQTAVDQAALYRLSGDLNPLHIDPSMAMASGYEKPILHGLCSLGISSRHVLAKYGGNNASNFKALKARFAKPVTPGQTLVTEMWLEGKRVFFQTKVKETGKIVITGAYVDLKNIVAGETKAAGAAPAAQSSVSSAGPLKSDAVFAKVIEEIGKNSAQAKTIGGVFLYNITENGKTIKQWTIDLKQAVAYEGAPKEGKADTTVSISDEDMVAISAGTLQPQVAYLKGKLKISGNLMLAQKLGPLLESKPKV